MSQPVQGQVGGSFLRKLGEQPTTWEKKIYLLGPVLYFNLFSSKDFPYSHAYKLWVWKSPVFST